MAKAKKLTPAQTSALRLLEKGRADYYELAAVGANGATISWLVSLGLSVEVKDGNLVRAWELTSEGRACLEIRAKS